MAIKKKRITKASKHRLMIFGTLSCIILFYFLFNLVTYSYRIKKLNEEENRLLQQLKALKEEENELHNEINKLKDPDYLARYARENYLYTKDGEYVIKVDQNKKSQKTKSKKQFQQYIFKNKTYVIIGSILLSLTILYILKTLGKDSKKVNE